MRDSIRLPATLILASVAARLVSLAGLHPLNWDEIEFFRATRWVAQGLVPYRDFWEHHTPLQWFLFAPVAALIGAPGAKAILLMRWAQVPLWIAIFWLIDLWMRDAGIARWPRWAAMAVPLTSSLFMLPAVEYRVDVLAAGLLVAALVCVQRGQAFAAGTAFCLAGFANLRFGPVAVVAMVLMLVTSDGRWRLNRKAPPMLLGAAVTFAAGVLYFMATHSAAIAFRRLWTDNYIADRLQPNAPGMFIHRVLAPFGVRYMTFPGVSPFSASAIDPAGMIIVLVGLFGIIRALGAWRAPNALFNLALLQLANLLFTAKMKYVFNYHLELSALLMVPFLAVEIARFERRRLIATVLCVTAAVNVAVALFRGKEADTRYQDTIMQAADRSTAPDETVFDGTGWALHRRPAYRYWILREIARILEERGYFEPYRLQQAVSNPPAAVIADHDAALWMTAHPRLGQFVTAHYLPMWRDLWLPGPNAVLSAERPVAQWIVPAGGTYRVFASARLASHPWFRAPYALQREHDAAALAPTDADAVDRSGATVAFSVPLNGGRLQLQRLQPLEARFGGGGPVGVMLVREGSGGSFLLPPDGVTLEASVAPQWHVPDLSVLRYNWE